MRQILPSLIFCTVLWSLQQPGFAQNQDSVGNLLTIDAHYGAGLPLGDLQQRFGTFYNLGSCFTFLTSGRWHLGASYDFLFGNKVKEDVLSNLRTVEGGIIGRDMKFASIFLRERGHHFSLEGGRLIGLNSNQGNSGLLLSAGLGYLRHKIRIVDDFDSVIQIQQPYDKGYDRLTGGWSLQQKIAYQYLGKDKLVNYRITLFLIEAFTNDLRGFHYNLEPVKSNRLDIIAGIQVGWIIPAYLTRQTRYY